MRVRLSWVRGILLGLLCAWLPSFAEIIEEIVAKINDQVITKSELETREGLLVQDLFQRFAGQELDENVAEGRENLLRDLIAEKLLLERGKAILDMEKVEGSLLKDFMERQGIEDREELEELLQREGMTITEFLESLVRLAVPQEILNFEVRNKIRIGEEVLRAYYEGHQDRFEKPGTVSFRELILLSTPENRSEILETMERLREEILQGADFLEMVREHSQAPSQAQGGLVGPFRRGDLLDPIAQVAFSLGEGEISTPIELAHGFHLIRLEERREERLVPFEEVKEEIRKELRQRDGEERTREYILKLWEKSFVYVYPRYQHRLPADLLEHSKRIPGAKDPGSP